MDSTTKYIVLGSGVAGLSFAIKLAEHAKKHHQNVSIELYSKANIEESNTKYAQGGIAAVQDFTLDSFEKHINDTLDCGSYICDEKIVRKVVREASTRIDELVDWGMLFDKCKSGNFDLAKEGGHSEHRILHSKDITGLELQNALIRKVKTYESVKLHSFHFVSDILVHDGKCYGALITDLKSNKSKYVFSSFVLLATGGVGAVYKTTTNPLIATGDGIAMANRVGVKIIGMEFIQFHPTALYGDETPSFLISEAVRGFGAILKNKDQEDFCQNYDPRASLAPRDVVSRAISSELKKGKTNYVYLDLRHLDINKFRAHFPHIFTKCNSIGLDLTKDGIPVAPAAHYLCGGIVVDEFGATNVKGLYACGECANTGLHGANRLASNSLLEALVCAHTCYESAVNIVHEERETSSLEYSIAYRKVPEKLLEQRKLQLQQLMSQKMNVVKTRKGIIEVESTLIDLNAEYETFEQVTEIDASSYEYLNMITVARLICTQVQNRKSNIGLHYIAS